MGFGLGGPTEDHGRGLGLQLGMGGDGFGAWQRDFVRDGGGVGSDGLMGYIGRSSGVLGFSNGRDWDEMGWDRIMGLGFWVVTMT